MDGLPADSPRADSERVDSEDARGGIGVNLCHPPLLPRVAAEPLELPGLGAEPMFDLPLTVPVVPRAEKKC